MIVWKNWIVVLPGLNYFLQSLSLWFKFFNEIPIECIPNDWHSKPTAQRSHQQLEMSTQTHRANGINGCWIEKTGRVVEGCLSGVDLTRRDAMHRVSHNRLSFQIHGAKPLKKRPLDITAWFAYPLLEPKFQRFRSPSATIPKSNSRVPITGIGANGTLTGEGAMTVGAGGEVGVYVDAVPAV